MAPVIQTTPRKDGKTQEQVDADMETHLNAYYIGDDERIPNVAGNNSIPPAVVSKPKAKRPARVNSPESKAVSESSDLKSGPSTRKSARVASKRAAAEAQLTNEDGEQAQPPAKKIKISPPENATTTVSKKAVATPAKALTRAVSKRSASTAYGSDEEAGQDQEPPKRMKMSPGKKTTAVTSKSTTTTPTRKSTRATTAKKTDIAPASATTQKATGRLAPISKELPKAKYVEKKPVASNVADETEEDATEDGDVEDQEDTTAKAGKGKSKGKGKQPAVKAFQGTKSGFGTSIEKPADAPLDQPWKCANRDCNSGQTYHPRDGPNSFGRKVISNFFGRNKKETNLIDADVWHNYCRKCYQRGTYRVNVISNLEKVKYYISNIDMQLDRIQLWRPEATFTVQLSKGASARLSKYYKERTKQGATTASAQAAVSKNPETNSKGKVKPLSLEDAFPIDLLEHFEDNYASSDQSFTDLKAILHWVTNLAENRQINSMPPMEFLIDTKADDEEIIDPATNYHRWCASEDGVEFDESEEDGEATQETVNVSDEAETSANDRGETEITANDEHETKETGVAMAPENEQTGNDDDETEVGGHDGEDVEQAGTDDVEKAKDAGNDVEEREDGSEDDTESDDESDAEINHAIGALTHDAIGLLTHGAAGFVTNPGHNDFYGDDEQSDGEESAGEESDDESADEGLNQPKTPSPPPKKPFKLTPTGIGPPIRPGQSSTYYTRDLGPANLYTRPNKTDDYDSENSSEAGSTYKRYSMWHTNNNTTSTAGVANKRKRDIEEEYNNQNFNDTSSEGESASKKQKL